MGLSQRVFACVRVHTTVQLCLQGFYVLELFHGPTLAFKDLALTLVGRFLQYFLQKRQKHVTILVGTSGDTGEEM